MPRIFRCIEPTLEKVKSSWGCETERNFVSVKLLCTGDDFNFLSVCGNLLINVNERDVDNTFQTPLVCAFFYDSRCKDLEPSLRRCR